MAKPKKRRARANCTTVYFTRDAKGRLYKEEGHVSPRAVVRCKGRKLATSAKRRWSRLKGKVICRNKRTGTFGPCRVKRRKAR